MIQVTADQVKQAALAKGVRRVLHHPCALCQVWTFYVIEGDTLFYDSSCDCCPCQCPTFRPWQNAADWINMQTEEIHRKRIVEAFGLEGQAWASENS